MAKSGSFSKTFSTGYTLKVAWTESNIDTANNQSDITCTVTLSATGSYYISSSASKNISLTINGTKYTSTCTVGISAGGSKTLMTKTVSNITHSSDGSKTISISCTLGIAVTLGGSYVSSVTASGSATLTTIARKSTLSASNGTLNKAQTLTVSRQDSTFTHTITYTCGTTSGTIATKSSSTSISWTPPLSLASQNTTGTTVTVKFTITTYNSSGTSLGSNTKTITCSIPTSVKPSLSLSVSDGAGYLSTYGGYIKSKSTFKVVLTATTSYGSAIKTYSTTANGKTYTASSFTTGVISSSGTLTISAKITDARGRTATASTSVTVLDYKSPSITGTTIKRCNSDGTSNSKGEYLKVAFSASITSLSSKNSATYKIQYKKKSDTRYSSVTLSSYTGIYTVSGGSYIFAADTSSAYNVRILATDNFSTTTIAVSGSYGERFMSWFAKGKGVAFGKLAELAGYVDIGWKIIFRQHLYMDNYSDAEKNFYFQNDASRQGKTYENDGVYPHNCKFYGGNGTSRTGIGLYDGLNNCPIWVYDDVNKLIDSSATLKYTAVTVTINSTNATEVAYSARAYHFLRLVVFNARFTVKEITSGATTEIGTISSGYAPVVVNAPLSIWINSSIGTANCAANISTGGNINLHFRDDVNGNNLESGKYVFVSGIWTF